MRELRGTPYPDLVEAAQRAKEGGADQMTLHLREDRRHIKDKDLRMLKKQSPLPLNLEMAATEEMAEIAGSVVPKSITLVPERREEKTTESGLDLNKLRKSFTDQLPLLKKAEIVLCAFIEPDRQQVALALEYAFHQVEFHTGPYVHALLRGDAEPELQRIRHSIAEAKRARLKVAAGHGLHYTNIQTLIESFPEIEEYNIGHSIVCRAVLVGIKQAVQEMKNLLQKGNRI